MEPSSDPLSLEFQTEAYQAVEGRTKVTTPPVSHVQREDETDACVPEMSSSPLDGGLREETRPRRHVRVARIPTP